MSSTSSSDALGVGSEVILLRSYPWRRDRAETRPTVSPVLSDRRREWRPIHRLEV